jgi:hypothetical protein
MFYMQLACIFIHLRLRRILSFFYEKDRYNIELGGEGQPADLNNE